MYKAQGDEILNEFEAVDRHLGWQEEKGILTDNSKMALYLVQIARPFLKTLVDIAESLTIIANKE